MTNINTRDLDQLSGAVYFAVGRGTEGGAASYRLSVAGVTNAQWGQVGEVAANSGYSMGTIQVDFGQRGTWPVGAISDRPLRAGEQSYVDAVIDQARAYAGSHNLPFPNDVGELRSDLLTHGNGKKGRSSIDFIDASHRDTINAWASSDEGKRWIHSNIDYPQVRNATETALGTLAQHGSHISDDRRFEAICILAKTANQFPSQYDSLIIVLRNGGDYDALMARAEGIRSRHPFYDGPKAGQIAESYERAFAASPEQQAALERAQEKVSSPRYDPSSEARDADINVALGALGSGGRGAVASTVLEVGSTGSQVKKLESNLVGMGYVDSREKPLQVDTRFTAETKHAVELFQQASSLEKDGRAGRATLGALNTQVRELQANLSALGLRAANGSEIRPDGYYGADTREAVSAFQRAQGLPETGITDAALREQIAHSARAHTPESLASEVRDAAPESRPDVRAGMYWPAPGNSSLNIADKPREGGGEWNSPRNHRDGDGHDGIDIQGRVGDPIVAVKGGTATAYTSRTAGNFIVVDHGDGTSSRYLHLDTMKVAPGETFQVRAGEQIGTMGRTGNTPAQGDTHLHFEYKVNGRDVDPLPLLNGAARTGAAVPGAGEARASAPSALSDGVLKLKDRGPEVVELQERLNALGYTGRNGQPLETNSGIYGPETEFAVRTFQQRHGLEVDGKAGIKETLPAVANAQQNPLVSERTHAAYPLYQAIAGRLPEGTRPEAIANVTLQAMQNGFDSPDKIKMLAVSGSDAFLAGEVPGHRLKVDLSAPTGSLQAMSDHMTREAAESAQRDANAERNRPATPTQSASQAWV